MTRYNLYEYSIEIRNTHHNKALIEHGCTYGYDGDSDPELIKSFDSLDDAKIYMNEHCTARVDRVGSTCWGLFEVYEYFIFKADYDEDGEEIDDENNYDPVAEMLIPDDWNACYTVQKVGIKIRKNGNNTLYRLGDDGSYKYDDDAKDAVDNDEGLIGIGETMIAAIVEFVTYDFRDGSDRVTDSAVYHIPTFTPDNCPVDDDNFDYDEFNKVVRELINEEF